MRGVVKALNRGTKDTIADPPAALALMKALDPMMKTDVEKVRLDLALDLTKTPHVEKYGSVVDPAKLQFTIDIDRQRLPAIIPSRLPRTYTPTNSCRRLRSGC